MPPDGPLEPVVEDGIVRNAGGTILGADNKAAVVVMLEAARRIVRGGRAHAGVELLFTPKEEIGLLGAYAFDHTRLEARLGYVYDQAAPIGEIILGAPSQQAIHARFHGRASHAGMYPEEGRSAILAAARAIADMRLGRIDDESSANVGRDPGRHGAEHRARVVHARGRGTLARRRRRSPTLVQEMLDAIAFAASTSDCTVETESRSRTAATASRGRPRRAARRRRRSAGRATSRRPPSRAARPTRTSSTSAGCRASTSRTA